MTRVYTICIGSDCRTGSFGNIRKTALLSTLWGWKGSDDKPPKLISFWGEGFRIRWANGVEALGKIRPATTDERREAGYE